MHLWSERPGARIRQIVADIATLTWVAIWISIGVGLYRFLAQLAGAGRFISDSGNGLDGIGVRLAGALQGVPLVGKGAADGIRTGFAAAADPMIRFGGDLERLLILIAALLGLLLAAAALVPWLNRYLPWRIAAWRRLNAGARVIRRRRFARSVPSRRPSSSASSPRARCIGSSTTSSWNLRRIPLAIGSPGATNG